MTMEHVLWIISTAAVFAMIFNVSLKRLGISPVLGYIVSGIIISHLFNLPAFNQHTLHEIAEFGIVFMLFTVGLEFSLSNFKRLLAEVLFNGLLQLVITSGFFTLLAFYVFQISLKGSILTGAAMALSSTAIVLKYFTDKREMDRPYAREAVGILIFQDLAVIAILIMAGIFTKAGDSLGGLLLNTFFGALFVFFLIFFAGRYVLNRFLGWIAETHSHELFLTAILLILVGASVLAHAFGFSFALGAFLAGMMIAETHYKYQVEADLAPFRDLLLGVFFVSVGMQINLVALFGRFGVILVMVIGVMSVKALIIFLILIFKRSKNTSIKTAVALSQVGEFSFVIFEEISSAHMISRDHAQMMIIVVTISMFLTPLVLLFMDFVIERLRRQRSGRAMDEIPEEEDMPGTGRVVEEGEKTRLDNHIIVCGYGYYGQKIVDRLVEQNMPYIVIEFQRSLVELARRRGHEVLFGNAGQKSILKKAGIRDALSVIISIEDEKKAILISQRIVSIDPDINIVVKSSHRQAFDLLKKYRNYYIIDEHEELAKLLVHYAVTCDLKLKEQV